MEHTDYYKFMGLSRNASQDTIKGAYRRLARQYHPDTRASADAEDLFKELGHAYGVLKDPLKRAMYDSHLNQMSSGPKTKSAPVTNRTNPYRSTHSDNVRFSARRSLLFVFGPIMLLVGALVISDAFTRRDDMHAHNEIYPAKGGETNEVENNFIKTNLAATAKAWR